MMYAIYLSIFVIGYASGVYSTKIKKHKATVPKKKKPDLTAYQEI